ncbi:protein tyrosine phosphatase [Salinisphaera sp. C84B14]|uniref:arsenate reductase ArsC n=1 Tax=Salinisphaera sp. C84B14 TaxID=1304155 RepID=UPI00333F0969
MGTENRRYNVLFLCTHNSARSIFAEALVNAMPDCGLDAYSAGSEPAADVHPQALALLESLSIPTAGLHSKHWDTFATPEAPAMDFVFTVCDKAAQQTCPAWPGKPVTAHWGVPDPSIVTEDAEASRKAFRQAFHMLRHRIQLFASLPIEARDRLTLQREVDAIGRQVSSIDDRHDRP